MIDIIRSKDRGLADHGWLNSRHTFSFGEYHNPARMGFSVLRVINEDRIQGGTGFDTHGHKDMEIISYVIDGALEHRDSTGTHAVIRPGEIQRMSAGSGVRHSEHNHLKDRATHFLQIWILPEKKGIAPGYDQKSFESDLACSDLLLVASHTGKQGSATLNQDVDIYACKAPAPGEKTLTTFAARHAWVQVVRGQVEVNGETLSAGDGAGLSQVERIALKWQADTEFLLLDLP
jgi:redox-sensitive bicupin YhaK (pirin superfamily)